MSPPLGRIQRAADFERVLQERSRARSHWFALHHRAEAPSRALPPNLSTGSPRETNRLVDESAGCRHWLGFVVPKRMARRAVTRNLVKRLARHGFAQRLAQDDTTVPAGLWVLRLRSPIDRQRFVSADSPALRAALQADLQSLWRRLAPQAASQTGTAS